jgi:hypothetical protein
MLSGDVRRDCALTDAGETENCKGDAVVDGVFDGIDHGLLLGC